MFADEIQSLLQVPLKSSLPTVLSRTDKTSIVQSREHVVPISSTPRSSRFLNFGWLGSPRVEDSSDLNILIRQENLGNRDEVNLLIEASGMERRDIVQTLEILKLSRSPIAYRLIMQALLHKPYDFNDTITRLERLGARGTPEDYQISLVYLKLQGFDTVRVVRELEQLTPRDSKPHDYTLALQYLEAKQYNYESTKRSIDKINAAARGNTALFSHSMCTMRDSGFSDNALPR